MIEVLEPATRDDLHIPGEIVDLAALRDERLYRGVRLDSEVEYQARVTAATLADFHVDFLAPLAGRMLDIGCGQATYLHLLPDTITEWVGVDGDHASLRLALANVPDALNARLVQQWTTPLPFDDASFDVVVSSEVIEHVDDPVGHIAEIARLLRPGGKMSLSTPCPSMYLTPLQLARGVQNPGQWWRYLHAHDCWDDALAWHPALRPKILSEWVTDAGFDVARQESRLWFYDSRLRPAWRAAAAAEKVIGPAAGRAFAGWLRFMDRVAATGAPGIRWMGSRQFIVATKR